MNAKKVNYKLLIFFLVAGSFALYLWNYLNKNLYKSKATGSGIEVLFVLLDSNSHYINPTLFPTPTANPTDIRINETKKFYLKLASYKPYYLTGYDITINNYCHNYLRFRFLDPLNNTSNFFTAYVPIMATNSARKARSAFVLAGNNEHLEIYVPLEVRGISTGSCELKTEFSSGNIATIGATVVGDNVPSYKFDNIRFGNIPIKFNVY